jgi:hemerythrin
MDPASPSGRSAVQALAVWQEAAVTLAFWSRRYETGLPVIDDQHRALFAAINRVAESYRTGSSSAEVKSCMNFLVDYIIRHFRDEEAHMKLAGFPKFLAHVGQHGQLFAKVKHLQARMDDDQCITMEVTIFLADWLKHHIQGMDMDFVRFVRSSPGGGQLEHLDAACPAPDTGP